VTFLKQSPFSPADRSEADTAIVSLDTFTMAVLSRGKTAADGGSDQGVPAKAAHSFAILWADLIRNLEAWSHVVDFGTKDSGGILKTQVVCDAPMLAAVAFSPILAQAGSAYLSHLHESYLSPTLSNFQNKRNIMLIVKAASSLRDSPRLSSRERFHLLALHFLLNNDHRKALSILNTLLESCPGDAFGLCLALDIANAIDRGSGLRAASSVAAYWNERGKTAITGQALPGHSIGCGLIAVGFAIGGQYRESEQIAEHTMRNDNKMAGGLAAWALAHVYDAEGRVSEGASLLSGFDGMQSFAECGFLFFDSILGGYGGSFVLGRAGASADQATLRIYDENFGRIFEYSGYNEQKSGPILRYAPLQRHEKLRQSMTKTATSLWGGLFPSAKKEISEISFVPSNLDGSISSQDACVSKPIILEDVLSWIPPTPPVLTEATILLLRLTMSGAINADDERWNDLQVAWTKVLTIEKKYSCTMGKNLFKGFSPLARITCSIVLDKPFSDGNEERTISSKLEKAANLLSRQMKIGQKNCENALASNAEDWREICILISEARSGWTRYMQGLEFTSNQIEPLFQDLDGLNLNFHNFCDYVICYSALKSKDSESLCIARSICSENVTLRLNSPENWWRYSLVLEELGDSAAAENARATSISLGAGEGGKVSAF